MSGVRAYDRADEHIAELHAAGFRIVRAGDVMIPLDVANWFYSEMHEEYAGEFMDAMRSAIAASQEAK